MSNKTDNAADVGTAGPWRAGTRGGKDMTTVYTADGAVIVCHVDTSAPEDGEREANAAFIARACNSHANLLAACEAAESLLEREGYFGGVVDQLNAAIAKARGQ